MLFVMSFTPVRLLPYTILINTPLSTLGLRHHSQRVDVVVNLLEAHEEGADDLPTARNQYHYPIPSGGVPQDNVSFQQLIQQLLGHLRKHHTTLLHSVKGIGRSGLLAACMLIEIGHDAETAIRLTQVTRPGALSNAAQKAWIRAWHSLKHSETNALAQ